MCFLREICFLWDELDYKLFDIRLYWMQAPGTFQVLNPLICIWFLWIILYIFHRFYLDYFRLYIASSWMDSLTNGLLLCPSGEEQLAGPTLYERGSGRERYQTHQRAGQPRGLPLRDHVRGAQPDHTGHPHGPAGDHQRGSQSVYERRTITKMILIVETNMTNQIKLSIFTLGPSQNLNTNQTLWWFY